MLEILDIIWRNKFRKMLKFNLLFRFGSIQFTLICLEIRISQVKF